MLVGESVHDWLPDRASSLELDAEAQSIKWFRRIKRAA
jgi:hypothetical protein